MFSISTRNLPRIASFQDCEYIFTRTDRLRSRAWGENERPLESSRMHHKRLVKNNDGTYSCTLYSCAHVTYYPDGKTVHVNLFDSISSRKFLDRMLPQGLTVASNAGHQLLAVHTEESVEWLQSGGSGITLKKTGPSAWSVVSGTVPRRREFVCRQKSKEARQVLKPFEAWYQAASNVVPFGYVGYQAPPRELPAMLADKTHWPRLASHIHNVKHLRNQVYDLFGVRTVQTIPNTTPPRPGTRDLS